VARATFHRGKRLAGAALVGAAACVGGPATADPIAPAALVPALNVYVDSLVLAHAAAAACTDATSPARDDAAWQAAKATFVATLWASGFPIDFVRTASRELDAEPGKAKPDCQSPAVIAALRVPAQEGWLATIQHPLASMDLKPILEPVSATAWGKIKAAFTADLPRQQRLFECVAVSVPDLMPAAVHDWDQALSGIGVKLVTAGVPRDEVSAELSTAEANTIWHRAPPDAEAELRDSCSKEQAWSSRLQSQGFMTLGATIDALLPSTENDP